VAQLVTALRYKPADRGFDSRWCHWDQLKSLADVQVPGMFPGGKSGRGVELTNCLSSFCKEEGCIFFIR
jgi:hypothetical protein